MLIGNNMFTSIDDGVGGLSNTLIEIQLGGNPWADDACVPDALADVANERLRGRRYRCLRSGRRFVKAK